MKHLRNRRVVFHTDSAKSYKLRVDGVLHDRDAEVLAAFVLPEPGSLEGVRSKGKRFLNLENVSFTYSESRVPAVKGATGGSFVNGRQLRLLRRHAQSAMADAVAVEEAAKWTRAVHGAMQHAEAPVLQGAGPTPPVGVQEAGSLPEAPAEDKETEQRLDAGPILPREEKPNRKACREGPEAEEMVEGEGELLPAGDNGIGDDPLEARVS
eukprot:s3241_g2.t1